MKKYTIADLGRQYPTEDACLEAIFRRRFPEAQGYYRVRGRKCYSHKTTRHQIYPLAGTIFEGTTTPLTLWFHALYLFSISRNGLSAKELQRHIGVGYKTAWRMCHRIRGVMKPATTALRGTVEVDETYYGKGGSHRSKYSTKQALLGMVERNGRIRVKTLPNRRIALILPVIQETIEKGTHVVTDEYHGYHRLSTSAYGYRHSMVKHGKDHYSWKGQNTNTIEGFWGQFKRSVKGTYGYVSKQHLQSYVDEFVFKYNQRLSSESVFEALLERI